MLVQIKLNFWGVQFFIHINYCKVQWPFDLKLLQRILWL